MEIRQKQKPLKLSKGGGLPPFVSFTPVPRPANNAAPGMTSGKDDGSKQDKDNKKKLGLITEDMIKLMYNDGLVSDVQDFVSKLDLFMTSEFDDMPLEASVGRYKMLIMGLAKIKEGKRQLVDAQNKVHANDAMNEIAVSNNNTYYILSKDGQIQESVNVKPGEKVLTNAELLDLRANYLPYADNITSIVSQAPSMKSIDNKISKAISSLGKEDFSNTFIYSAQDKEEIIDGVHYIMNTKDGLGAFPAIARKGDNKVVSVNNSNAKNVEKALAYIYSTLSTREKGLLQAKAQQMGDDSPYGAFKILQGTLSSKVNITNETTVLPINEKTGSGSSGSGSSGSGKQVNVTPTIAYATGEMGEEGMFEVNPRSNVKSILPATIFNTPLDNENKPLSNISLEDFMPRAVPFIGNAQGVYFGEQKVDPTEQNQILVGGDSMARIRIPVDKHDPNKPDFEIFDRYSSAVADSYNVFNKSFDNLDENEKVQLLKKHDLDELLSSANGRLDPNRFGLFMAVTAYAGQRPSGWLGLRSERGFVNSDVNNNFIGRIEEGTANDDYIKSKLKENNVKYTNDVYSGTLYIKMDNNMGALLGGNQYIPMTDERVTVESQKKKDVLINEKRKESEFNFKNVSTDLFNK